MKDILILIAMTALICMGGSVVGAAIPLFVKKNAERTLGGFLAFASGLTLAIVCLDLIPESIEGFDGSIGALGSVLFVAVGFALIRVIDLLLHGKRSDEDENCCHCHCHGDEKKSKKLFIAGLTMAFAIALHNLPVGIIIGSAYASSKASSLVFAVVIALHNIPEGMAISTPLISAGARKPSAIIITALTGLATVGGALIGFSIGSIAPFALSVVLSLAAGVMLSVATGELLPEAIAACHPKLASVLIAAGILAGMLIVFI